MDFDFAESRWAKILVVIAFVLIVGAAAVSGGLIKLSIAPGFEGEQNGIWGYQPNGQQAQPIGSALQPAKGACAYSYLGGDSISSAGVKATSPGGGFSCIFLPDNDVLVFSTQTNVIPYQDPYTTPITVKYAVPVPGQPNKYQLVVGSVQAYTFTTNVAVQSGSCGCWSFQGDVIWFNLYSNVWNNAAPPLVLLNGTQVQGKAFETPLYMVSISCQWQYQGADNAIGPCQAGGSYGGSIQFYNSPLNTGTCATLAGLANPDCTGSPPSSSINSTLSSIYAPDTRMQRLVYYPITITKMQSSCFPLAYVSCNPPSVSVTFKLYTLRIGEYILTNPDRQQLTASFQGCTGLACVFNAINGFLANPLSWLALLGIGGILLVVLLLVFAPTAVIILLLFLRRGKEE